MWGAAGLIISGCGLALAFTPGKGWLLLWMPALTFWLLRNVGWRPGLIGGWLWGLSFYLVHGFWGLPVFEQRAASPLYAGIAWAITALWLGFFYALFGLLLNLIPTTSWFGRAVGGASAWTVCQWLQGLGSYSLPWAQWGIALTQIPLLIQLVDLGGVWFLEWMIAYWNMLLCEFVRGTTEQLATAQLRNKVAAMLIVVALFWGSYGALRLNQYRDTDLSKEATKIRVGILQYQEHPIAERNEQVLDFWITKTQQHKPEWLVLPESTVQLDPSNPDWQRWQQHIRTLNSMVLVGTGRRVGSGYRANSACLLMTDREPVCSDKVKLMPFTELPPPLPTLSFWQALGLDSKSTVQSGKQPIALQGADGRRVGALICVESLYGWVAREMVRNDAQWIAVLTNDEWLPSGMTRGQFAQYCALRAVECRRWIARASSVGVSGFYAPTGELVASLPMGKPGVLVYPITPRTDQTLYVRWGDWWVYLCLAAMIVVWLGRLSSTDWRRA